MPEFMISYMGLKNKPASAQQGAEQRQEFMNWIGSLGDVVVNPGTPLGAGRRVSGDSVSEIGESEKSTGFSVIKADNLDSAVEISKSCPYLRVGDVEVFEVMKM